MRSDVVFFLGVILFFFIAWLAAGGPTRPISFAGPYITPITDVDTTQDGYGSLEAPGISYGSVWGDLMGGFGGTDLSAGDNPSPYRGKVRVSSNGGVSATDPDQEYVVLRASGDESIDITGWRLVSGASGRGARIPRGAALPSSGRVNDTDRIVLNPRDEAIVITGESPKGVSFKENKCTGYFEDNQDYYPALSLSCPSASQEFDRHYDRNALRDDKCYYRMQSTPSCTTPSDRDMTDACIRLIDEYLTYNGCVDAHRADEDFAGRTWRIYLEYENSRGKAAELWKPSRDAIKLLDADGKTVDLYTY
ncbi:MAG TPA: hypothetical protein VGE23_02950 [Candidatus Paceibacterota bacterium]